MLLSFLQTGTHYIPAVTQTLALQAVWKLLASTCMLEAGRPTPTSHRFDASASTEIRTVLAFTHGGVVGSVMLGVDAGPNAQSLGGRSGRHRTESTVFVNPRNSTFDQLSRANACDMHVILLMDKILHHLTTLPWKGRIATPAPHHSMLARPL